MTLLEYFLGNERLRCEWHSEKNAVEPTSLMTSAQTKVWWRCEKGHEWQATPKSRISAGHNCPYCVGQLVMPGENDLATRFPEMIAFWDYELNGELRPSDVTPGSHKKVWWKCELGHSWQAPPFSRTRQRSTGCPYCTGIKVLAGFNDLETLRPKLAREWCQPLNGELKPTAVTLGSHKKVWWRCAEGHVWQANIFSRTKKKGAGCPVCAGVIKIRKAYRFESRPSASAVHRIKELCQSESNSV